MEAVLAARWVRSCKVVHSEHGLEAGAAVREPRRRVWFRRLAYQLADRVFSVSYQLRDLHARRTGFDPGRITVIHNGVDRQRFCPDPAARARCAPRSSGLSDDEFCIGCVGNLFPVKGHITALQAIEEFAAQTRQLAPAVDRRGSGAGEAGDLRRRRIRSGRHRVQFLGTSHRVPELLNAMDVYVLPSVAEGISNSLLEAMASGVPVVATAPVAIRKWSWMASPGCCSRWAMPAGCPSSSAAAVRRQAAAQTNWRKRALRRVREEFSLESMVGKYAQLYESLGRRAAIRVQAAAGV